MQKLCTSLTIRDMEPVVLGEFRLLKKIARGGMGEVYQAYDTRCRRYVALKKIREDLNHYQGIRKRFLAEAHIAASLTHPSIISIFTIQGQVDPLYYTMPLLEGQSLKSLILKARKDPHLLTIDSIIDIFLSISQGIAHAHSRGFLHRDIKAENIWMGTDNKAVILDWGVAKSVSDVHDETLSQIWSELQVEDSEESEGLEDTLEKEGDGSSKSESQPSEPIQLTRPGKVVGTLAYLAPERALRREVSYASDIYSLGVLLYFMLTLHLPFRRKTLKEYLKVADKEPLIDPRAKAPFRDIPKDLVRMIERCLKFNPNERYVTVQELIDELTIFSQAGSDWVQHAELSPLKDRDWIGKEWVYLTTPIAESETLHPEPMGWVTRMISRASFDGALKVRVEIKPKDDAGGLGLLLCAPEQEPSHRSLDGYCIWIGAEGSPGGQLLRNGVMVLDLPGFCMRTQGSHQLTVECLDGVLHCCFDHAPKVTYVSYLPLIGSHVGLVVAKGHFDFLRLHIFGGKHSLQVSCLAVPDAFLSQKLYRQALSEYRRIGASFFDYLEGRQAIFRAGITLIEWSRQRSQGRSNLELLEAASTEFEKLKGTLSAPLEWLGKSLVYRELGQEQEELNALELACQRFGNHPLVSWLHEEVVFRLHEHTSGMYKLSCRIVLLIVRALPQFMQRRDVLSRVRQILSHLPVTSFWQNADNKENYGTTENGSTMEGIAIRMAYFLGDEMAILEMCRTMHLRGRLSIGVQARLLQNAIFSLLYMGLKASALKLIDFLEENPQIPANRALLRSAFEGTWSDLSQKRFAISYEEQRLIDWLLELEQQMLMQGQIRHESILALARAVLESDLNEEQAPILLTQVGRVLLGACVRIKATQASISESNQHALELELARWHEMIEKHPSMVDLPEIQLLFAAGKMVKGDLKGGFLQLHALQDLPTNHPFALLVAWIHGKLTSLKAWQEKALEFDKKCLLSYGWLLLHASHPTQEAAAHYLRLEEGEAYGTTHHA